ncbi:MAG: hypothetical protein LH615_14260, partial [Ferruginibacter sp.]|nr:hypothetical protein [Ferruginibacter sp.]
NDGWWGFGDGGLGLDYKAVAQFCKGLAVNCKTQTVVYMSVFPTIENQGMQKICQLKLFQVKGMESFLKFENAYLL